MDKRKKIDESIPRSIPEVYLTRLLTSKGTVQKYIEEFLESVMFLEETSYPPVIKYLFDLLEDEATRNGVGIYLFSCIPFSFIIFLQVNDHNLVQQWKSNLYVLRVWVHLVKNPRILLDVDESISQDGNLSVIAQTLMDCFSFSEPSLGAHSPSSRLLFAKEVTRLRPLSTDLFRRIRRHPKITEETFVDELNAIANDLVGCSGSTIALSELLTWVRGNGIRFVEVLSQDNDSIDQRLPQRLSQVINLCLEPDHIYSTIPEYSH
uniref:Plexin_cytopl domain-containing protein n=1 Tax=Heterorhabditis bacteriophora TaxID=37862 RepID=A0A1I7WMK6_HETBA